jgi:hypothetical protein
MTSIPYNLGIPASNHNPSVDQPDMLENNDNISALIAVDHVTFNSGAGATSGHHLQVTFDSNNPPAVPTAPPVLFTNTVAGLPQLFYYSGDIGQSINQYVVDTASGGTTGSSFMLGGLILKCGRFTGVTGVSTVLAYPNADTPMSPFPHATLCVLVTAGTPTVGVGVLPGGSNANQFTLQKTSSAATTIFFIAIGY